ncbi:M48 family metallopeptidase [Paraburkholderia podalyriae]|uniref:M48 family metalloprotease n=1 Tax=Paraburkholderia podalyriae TaxID=1938811 RepID=A0ABR7PFM7_9BURK|nr:M48 family metallopeptidase [Paraburkholderia podalyriae]MBC8745173.1 M48 family metalloprotease [Paraburkholderia podalyriae]
MEGTVVKAQFPTRPRGPALSAVCMFGCASVALAMPVSAYAAGAAATGASPVSGAQAPAPAAAAAATSGATPNPAPTPAAKSATSGPSAENTTPTSPGNNNAGGVNAGTGNSTTGANAGAPGTPSNSGSAPPAATSGSAPQSAQPPVTAKAPAAASAAAASAAAAVPPPYYVSPQLRYGGYMVFRNLIPSSMLEAQAAAEFNQIVYGASHANRLYGDTDARVTRVRSIINRMIPYSLKWNERAKGWKWEVAVVRSNDIRMYCLPGGKIVVYSGILDRARLNDNEVGMLIGHEIAHALREHARMRLGQLQASQLDSSGTIPQLFGLADLGMAPLGIGSRLLEMKYESTDETEADVIGSDIASRAGFDPRAAVTLWDKLAQVTRGNREQGFIYVHPYTPARREDIIKRLPDMLALYAKAIGRSVDELPDFAGIGRPTRKPVRD